MINNNNYIAAQQIQALSQSYGPVLNQIVDKLVSKYSGMYAPKRMQAELREAKVMLRQLRFGEEAMVRTDEMAWALKTVKEACFNEFGIHMDIFDKAAATFDAELNKHCIPMDLQRKINNEVAMFGSALNAAPMAQAV